MIKVGRWRIEGRLQVWRVRRYPHVVLWGARAGSVAFGSRADRTREMENVLMGNMLREMQRSLLREHLGLAPFGGVSVVAGSAMPTKFEWISDVDEDVQPLWKGSRLGPEVDRMWREPPGVQQRPAHGGYPS